MIDDGVCDGACRTDECLDDGGDCDIETSCKDDHCQGIYALWSALAGQVIYNVSVTIACIEWRDLVFDHDAGFIKDIHSFGACSLFLPFLDHKDDGYLNFKEVTPLIYIWATYDAAKALGVDCSACMCWHGQL